MTMGIKTETTPSMILRVRGLDDALNAVRSQAGFMLEGNKAGKRPKIPKKVHPIIVRADANQALNHAFFPLKYRAQNSAATAIMTENRLRTLFLDTLKARRFPMKIRKTKH